MVDDLFVCLGLDKHKWLQDIKREESSLASFLSCVEESIGEREELGTCRGIHLRMCIVWC